MAKKGHRKGNRKGRRHGKGRKKTGIKHMKGFQVNVPGLVFPRQCFTKAKTTALVLIQTGLSDNTLRYATIYANSAVQPWNTASPFTGSNFGSGTMKGGTSTVDSFVGFSQMNSVYNRYRVFASKLRIRPVIQSNSADMYEFGFFPFAQGQGTGLTGLNMSQLCGQPRSKHLIATGGQGFQNKTSLSQYVRHRDVMGLNKVQYEANTTLESAMNTQNANGVQWFLFFEPMDGAATTTQILIEVELTQYMQFESMDQPT